MFNFCVTLFYMLLTTYWLMQINEALLNVGATRIFGDPACSKKHAFVLYFWQVFYDGIALAGLTYLCYRLGYGSLLVDLYYLGWGLMALSSATYLVRAPFDDQVKRFQDLRKDALKDGLTR